MFQSIKTFLLILAMLLPAYSAQAAGFQGPGARSAVNRAADVLTVPDSTPCMLEGRIIEKLPRRANRYLFEDSSGRVIVEIKPRVFGDFTVTPQDIVRIVGEVDFDGKYPNEVEAEYLGIVGPAAAFNR